jgi:predicted RNA binding protein YcfA (HicA-like mRNA interferase family)
MPKLSGVTGKEIIMVLERAGFEVFDQTGSHVYLHKWKGKLKELIFLPNSLP